MIQTYELRHFLSKFLQMGIGNKVNRGRADTPYPFIPLIPIFFCLIVHFKIYFIRTQLNNIKSFICIVLIFSSLIAYSQKESFFKPAENVDNTRKNLVYYTYSIGTPVSFIGLYHLWYKEGGMSGFKFFNDNKDWLQMDKFGHNFSSYLLGEYAYKSLLWAGVNHKRAVIHGGIAGLIYMTGIEIMDGFAKDYGFSYGDMLANIAGTSIFISQELLWQEQRFRLKYSFFPSDYAQYRPEMLGDNIISQSLKDYNGLTFWLSVNLKSNLKADFIPDWLNLAFGYSAYGLTGGTYNPDFNAAGEPIPEFDRTRQYLLSLDIDLTRLNPKSDFLKTLCSVFGFIKIPFTTLEYNQHEGFVIHPVYF